MRLGCNSRDFFTLLSLSISILSRHQGFCMAIAVKSIFSYILLIIINFLVFITKFICIFGNQLLSLYILPAGTEPAGYIRYLCQHKS